MAYQLIGKCFSGKRALRRLAVLSLLILQLFSYSRFESHLFDVHVFIALLCSAIFVQFM